MKFDDIIALTKAGFTKDEIIALTKEEPKQEPKEEPKQEPKEEPKEELKQEPTAISLTSEQLSQLVQGIAVKTAGGSIELPKTTDDILLEHFQSVLKGD